MKSIILSILITLPLTSQAGLYFTLGNKKIVDPNTGVVLKEANMEPKYEDYELIKIDSIKYDTSSECTLNAFSSGKVELKIIACSDAKAVKEKLDEQILSSEDAILLVQDGIETSREIKVKVQQEEVMSLNDFSYTNLLEMLADWLD